MSVLSLTEEEKFLEYRIYGKRLYSAAWAVEIAAALLGLLIAGLTAYGAYQASPTESLLGSATTNAIVGALPFVIIAVVELTKIPLASGFYRARLLRWKYLFLFTLILLCIVTFETFFNGLERQFSNISQTIYEPRTELTSVRERLGKTTDEITRLSNLSNEFSNVRDEFDQSYSNLRNRDDTTRSVLRDSFEEQQSGLNLRIQEITETPSGSVDSLKTAIAQLEENRRDTYNLMASSAASIQERFASSLATQKGPLDTQLATTTAQISETQSSLRILGEQEAAALLECTFCGGVRNDYANKRQPYVDRLASLEEVQADVGNQILLASQKNDSELAAALNEDRTGREQSIREMESKLEALNADLLQLVGGVSERKQVQIDQLRQERQALTTNYEERKAEINQEFQEDKTELERRRAEKEADLTAQRETLPNLRAERTALITQQQALRNEINIATRNVQIYRVAGWMFDHENSADVEADEVRLVVVIWFGSLALIASTVGTILALAAFVLQDPDAYRPKTNRSNKFYRRLMYHSITRFFTERGRRKLKRQYGPLSASLRRMIVDLRRRLRNPVTRYVEKEKVVYKEVPREIVKKELVYVPLYSTDAGLIEADEGVLDQLKDNFSRRTADEESRDES